MEYFECKFFSLIPINLNMCFECSKKLYAFEYPSHMFWLRNKEINFQLHTLGRKPELQESHKLACLHKKLSQHMRFWYSPCSIRVG